MELDEPIGWDDYFIKLAEVVSLRSRDPSTKVGAVVVGPGKEILTTGYNGFARGVYDRGTAIQGEMRGGDPTGLRVVDFSERWQRPDKYNWVVHAEHNCVLNAARTGTSLLEATMYVMYSGTPCMTCCSAIIQAGIAEVVMGPTPFPGVGEGEFYHVNEDARNMLREADVVVRQL
jgi:dCMP deaminase